MAILDGALRPCATWLTGLMLMMGCAGFSPGSLCMAVSSQYPALEFPENPAAARDPRLELLRTGDAQSEKELFTQAEQTYREALAQFTAPNEQRQRALTLTRLGNTVSQVGQYSQALEYFRQAERIFVALDGEQGLTTANTRYGQGMILLEQQHWAEAFPLLDQSVAVFVQRLPPNDMFMVIAADETAVSHYQHSTPVESERHLRQALQVLARAHVDDSLRAAALNTLLADVLQRQGKYSEAATTAHRAVALYGGDDTRDSARASLQLGTALNSLRQWSEAEPYLRSAYERLPKFHDETLTAEAASELGRLYFVENRLTEAQPLIEAALRFADSTTPPGADRALFLQWLYELHKERKDSVQEEHYLRRRMELKYPSLDTPENLAGYNFDMGTLLAARAKHLEAQEYFARALVRYTQIFGSDSQQAIATERAIAADRLDNEEYTSVEPLLRHVLAYDRKTNNLETLALSTGSLGVALYKQRKSDKEAQALLEESLDHYQLNAGGAKPSFVIEVMSELAEIAARQPGQEEKVRAYYKRAWEIGITSEAPQGFTALSHRYGKFLIDHNDYAQAEEVLGRSYQHIERYKEDAALVKLLHLAWQVTRQQQHPQETLRFGRRLAEVCALRYNGIPSACARPLKELRRDCPECLRPSTATLQVRPGAGG
jgi:tetratricopeptide (TPR) repeat protein